MPFNEPEDQRLPKFAFSEKTLLQMVWLFQHLEYDHTIPAPLLESWMDCLLISHAFDLTNHNDDCLSFSDCLAHLEPKRNLRQILDAPELKARVMPGQNFS